MRRREERFELRKGSLTARFANQGKEEKKSKTKPAPVGNLGLLSKTSQAKNNLPPGSTLPTAPSWPSAMVVASESMKVQTISFRVKGKLFRRGMAFETKKKTLILLFPGKKDWMSRYCALHTPSLSLLIYERNSVQKKKKASFSSCLNDWCTSLWSH